MTPFQMTLLGAAALGLAACGNKPEPAPAAELAFVTEYTCGDQQARIGMAGDLAVLRVEGADFVLSPVTTASGAKYVVAGADPETGFWSKGGRGLLTLRGVEYPECTQTGEDSEPPVVVVSARWSLVVKAPVVIFPVPSLRPIAIPEKPSTKLVVKFVEVSASVPGAPAMPMVVPAVRGAIIRLPLL